MNQRVFYSKISPGSQADHIIDKMVGLWGSFAKTGIPSHPRQTHEWTPLPSKNEVQAEGLKYFNINMEDSMIDEPFTDRMGNNIANNMIYLVNFMDTELNVWIH